MDFSSFVILYKKYTSKLYKEQFIKLRLLFIYKQSLLLLYQLIKSKVIISLAFYNILPYLITMFTSFPGTGITLTTVLSPINAFILSAAITVSSV